MGYSIRTRSYRYTQWRRWILDSQLADWSNGGLVASELYDHRGNVDDADPGLFENDNLAGTYRFSMIESTMRTELESRVKASPYSNKRCGQNSVLPPPDSLRCTSATTELACLGLFASRCAWILGYGCQTSTFCGFRTKDRVKANKVTGATPHNLPDGTPGCSLFSSRCRWSKGRFTKLNVVLVE
jgi:hypothetical protein